MVGDSVCTFDGLLALSDDVDGLGWVGAAVGTYDGSWYNAVWLRVFVFPKPCVLCAILVRLVLSWI